MGVYQRSTPQRSRPHPSTPQTSTKRSILIPMNRREFLYTSAAFTTATAFAAPPLPLRFAHRQANIVVPPNMSVFEFATQIPGLNGIELQVIWKDTDLADLTLAADYKRQSQRWKIDIPSIAGIWKKGEKIFDTPVAERAITNAIRAADFLSARTILIALYDANCPVMSDESSYAPVVTLLQKLAPMAASANVRLGLETSLLPTDEKKLLTLINHSAVGSYFDSTNTETYHPGQAIPGIELLGPHIVQCHFKNGDKLLSAPDSIVNWPAAIKALTQIPYRGWYVFETKHTTPDQCIQATTENIKFITTQIHQNT